MSDLDKFLNEFEDELDNRDKIENKKSNLFDDIIKNLISELNKGSRNNQIVILKVDKFKDITTTIGDYIHSHTLSEIKELLNADKCIKLLGGKNKISKKLNVFDCAVTNLYGVYTIDSFINDMVDEKKKKVLSPKSIFGQSSQVRPQVFRWIEDRYAYDRYTYDDLLSTYDTTDLFKSDDSHPSLPSWRNSMPSGTPSVHKGIPSIPKCVLPWVPTSLLKIDSELSDENYGKTWCRIGDGTELDKKEFGGENTWNADGLLRKFSELMRVQQEEDEEYRERIRKRYGL